MPTTGRWFRLVLSLCCCKRVAVDNRQVATLPSTPLDMASGREFFVDTTHISPSVILHVVLCTQVGVQCLAQQEHSCSESLWWFITDASCLKLDETPAG